MLLGGFAWDLFDPKTLMNAICSNEAPRRKRMGYSKDHNKLGTRNPNRVTRNPILATRAAQLATRNSQRVTRNSQRVTRNSQRVTRNSHPVFL